MSRINFKRLCYANLMLLLLGSIVTFSDYNPMPPELIAYKEAQLNIPYNFYEVILTIFAIGALIGNIGLIYFANWARPLFTLGVIVTTVGMVFFRLEVYSSLEIAIYESGLVIDGMLIALAYFSPLKEEFKSRTT